MQFVLIIYHGTYPLPGTPAARDVAAEERQRAYKDYEELNALESLTPGPPLGLPGKATTVRVENGTPVTSGGPWLGDERAVGGFYVLEAEALEDAVEIASRIPQARLGGAVEIRPAERYW
jgi:hypothetical protein